VTLPEIHKESAMIEEQLETADFVERLRANDSRAWNLAYEPLYRVALAVVSKTLWNSKDHDVENLACEAVTDFVGTFLRGQNESHNSTPSFGDLMRMTSRIAKYRTLDYLRKLKRRPELEFGLEKDAPTSQNHGSFGPDLDQVLLCMEKLPQPLGQMLTDRHIGGKTVKEIASISGINYNTVCTYLARALKQVRDCLTKKGVRL